MEAKKIVGIMVIVALVAFSILVIVFEEKDNTRATTEVVDGMLEMLEAAYMEGQIDYSHGDKRIANYGDDDHMWTKSPWDEGKEPAHQLNSDYE